jgi:hypothetical protein
VLRALPSNGFTCHNTLIRIKNYASKIKLDLFYYAALQSSKVYILEIILCDRLQIKILDLRF